MSLEDFTQAYLECALWATTDSEGNPLDDNYGVEDIPVDVLEEMKADCRDFYDANYEVWHGQNKRISNNASAEDIQAGHDFWLTREGHGAGFWDGDWTKEVGRKLTESSKVYGGYDRLAAELCC